MVSELVPYVKMELFATVAANAYKLSSLVGKCPILYFARVPEAASWKTVLQYDLFCQKLFWNIFFSTKHPLADDSTPRAFPLYVNKLSLKQTFSVKYSWKDWLSQFLSVLIKKCMKILYGLVGNVCDNNRKVDYVTPETNYSWDKCFVAWCSFLLVT